MNRKLSLKQLHGELLHIAVNRPPNDPRFDALKKLVSEDLKRAEDWDLEPDQERTLSEWWQSYVDLSRFIRR